ncbi:MAG TPA: SLC13 family permease [Nocardioidaceae bacterium]|nr:SLC13 family permease [Nocardioidaceae bacterium]
MDTHVIGLIGLLLIFVIGTTRPVSLGALGIAMTFLVGTFVVGESVDDMYTGFPADLFVLLAGVTYLFALATTNGTVEWIIDWAARLVKGNRALVPWIVFIAAALPTMAGALGPATVAMLAPLSLGLATRYGLSQRMVGLMVIHGSAAGNFSPINPLGAIVTQTMASTDLEMSITALFFANLAYNLVLGVAIYLCFGGRALLQRQPATAEVPKPAGVGPGAQSIRESSSLAAQAGGPGTGAGAGGRGSGHSRLSVDQVFTLVAILTVAACSMVLELDIGFLAFVAAVVLHLAFPTSSKGADKRISWGVVLLICGVVTYVAALERYGTVEMVGNAIADMSAPLIAAFLLCLIGAFTSALASSAALLVALIPLAVPLMAQGEVGVTALIVAVAISATVVDSTPFSTVGALVVANSPEEKRDDVFRGLLVWGAVMVVTAPVLTWLAFVLPSAA